MIHTTISNYSHDQREFILSFCQMKQHPTLQITTGRAGCYQQLLGFKAKRTKSKHLLPIRFILRVS